MATITDRFKALGAPLHNQRWSWGSVRASDGAVFLRVWQDQAFVQDRRPVFQVTYHADYRDNPDNLGYKERIEHVDHIRAGAPCYLLVCIAKDINATPRSIDRVMDHVFVGGGFIERDGDTYVCTTDRVDWLTLCEGVQG